MTPSSIHARALLVSLRISAWTARRYDKKISEQVARDHSATPDAGRYNKMLLAGDAASYKAVMSAVTAARNTHYTQTLAWSDEGPRLLPTDNLDAYTAAMREAQRVFDEALDTFLADYPALQENARVRLNGMYRDEDYPSVEELRRKFAFAIDYLPLPASEDFRCALPAAERERIERSLNDRVNEATVMAQRDAWQRLYTCVEHVYERLSQPDAVFRDSLIENARELTDVLARLNVTGDRDLERLRSEVESQIAAVSAEDLRSDQRLRSDVADSANVILRSIRRIRRVDVPNSNTKEIQS